MPRTVLITGAGSGFGRMAAAMLASRGHKVVATVLNEEQAADLRKAEPKLTVAKLDIIQRVAQMMRKKRSGRIIIMSSIGGVRAGVGSGPYTMTKHAVQAMGTALRAELAHFGVDVCLINPGPFATGFNDRMAKNPGEWFDRKAAAPEDVAVMDALVQRIAVGQLDPVDVAKRYVELVEAEKTELVNFVPPDIVERMS